MSHRGFLRLRDTGDEKAAKSRVSGWLGDRFSLVSVWLFSREIPLSLRDGIVPPWNVCGVMPFITGQPG
jgi:hypothetical protein